MGNSGWLYFGGSKLTADGDCSHEIRRWLLLGRKVMTNLDSILKSRDMTLAKKGPSSQSYDFSSSHVWMWELDHKESWAPKNWCFWTVVLEKTLESPLDCKEINPVIIKEIKPEYSLEGPMLKLSLQYFGQLMWRTDSLEKNPVTWKDWRQEGKRMTEDEIVGWNHQLDGHNFAQAPGVGEEQRALVCCSPWGCRIGCDWVTEQQQIINLI